MQTEAADQARKQSEAEARVVVCFFCFLALARRKPNGFEKSRKLRPVRTRVAVSFLFLAFLVGRPAWVYIPRGFTRL